MKFGAVCLFVMFVIFVTFVIFLCMVKLVLRSNIIFMEGE